jgi:hypothetical protein
MRKNAADPGTSIVGSPVNEGMHIVPTPTATVYPGRIFASGTVRTFVRANPIAQTMGDSRALAGMMNRFRYLKVSLAALLALIGLKMLLKDVLHALPGLTYYTLGAIALVLAAGMIASLVHAGRGPS